MLKRKRNSIYTMRLEQCFAIKKFEYNINRFSYLKAFILQTIMLYLMSGDSFDKINIEKKNHCFKYCGI